MLSPFGGCCPYEKLTSPKFCLCIVLLLAMTRLEMLLRGLAQREDRVVALQTALTACRALGPDNGGQGEMEKACFIEACLRACGVSDLVRLDAPDPRVESGVRPNLIARFSGTTSRTLWLFAHTDVVPPGDISAWSSDPWTVYRTGDVLYGRGVEDNQQAIVSMLLLAEELSASGITPALSLGLVFMADEETGSAYGLRHILAASPELFHADDYYIVPDGGSPHGDSIELAEKGQLWVKVVVKGAQCHASTPQKGRNAFVAASAMVLACQEQLHAVFHARDTLYDPPYSTFVPSKHEANVPNINTVPGEDIFYMDCRLLPQVTVDAVLAQLRVVAADIEQQYGVHIETSIVQRQNATSSPMSHPVVMALQEAVAHVYAVQARPIGIGGATVAAFLRERELPAAVWSCIDNSCHAPNEHASITSTIKDAQVFAHILMQAHV